MSTKKKKKQARQTAVQVHSTEEMRKIIEDARRFVDTIGEFKMEFNGVEYTIRLSRLVKGRVTYDPRTGEVVIVLPDQSLWRQCRDGNWDRHTMNIHIDHMEKIHEQQQMVEWGERVMRRVNELAALSSDAGRYETMKENAVLSKQLYDAHNKIQEMEWRYMAAAAEACRLVEENGGRLKRVKEDKDKAEGRAGKAEAALARTEGERKESDKKNRQLTEKLQDKEEELKNTKARNSRLAAENNKIKTGKRNPYKKAGAGKKGGKREAHRCMPVTKRRTADQHACHVCHATLGEIADTYPRILEDMELGRWEVIEYEVTKRWCPHCKCVQSTPIPGARPKQRFGNRVLAMLSFLKMMGVSFRKIELIFLVFYNVHISKKTIQEAVRTVSHTLTPQYEAIHAHILEGDFVNGDETSWYVTGLLYWVWCVVGADAVWFNIQKGRGTDEAKIMLPDFEGLVTSDSWPAWNHVGKEHEKCHLHYKRDIKKTMEENHNPEFQAFAKKLLQILRDSHGTEKGHNPDDDLQTRTRKQRNLMRRLAYLIKKDYIDKDCKRYLKRLRREFYHLFSHVTYGIDWHNNKAERAVRCFVLLRHVMFGNRTEFDADAYAKLLSITGTCAMRDVNPLEYMVEEMSKPHSSPVELPRPPTDPK